MPYPMSEADREIQQRARAFVDQLLPFEVQAELHGGELPAEVDRIWEGTSEIQRAIIASQLAKRGVARLIG
jgi:hypothetical protein